MILGLHGTIGQHALAAETGATHVRLVAREPFTAGLDAQVRACREHNLQLVVTLAITKPQTKQVINGIYEQAKRFPELVWQVGNEPARREPRQWTGSDVEWVNEFIRVSMAIKQGSDATVIAGGITGSLAQMEQHRQRITSFLEAADGHYDIVDVHSYEDDYRALANKAAFLRSVGVTKPIWSMENSGPFSDGAWSEAATSEFVVKSLVTAFANGVEAVFWGSLVPVGGGWSDAFLRLALYDERGKTPAFESYRILASKCAGRTGVSHDIGDNRVAIHSIRANSVRPVFVAWSKSGRDEKYTQRLRATTATVTRIPTARGVVEKPKREPIKGNVFSLVVNEPCFVEFG